MFGPRQAILTLYGDYILNRGGEIGIGSLVQILGNFGLSEPSVRSAISRMRLNGLLKVRREGQLSYYSLTNSGRKLLTEGAQRIFERKETGWDGAWSVVTYSVPERRRGDRDKLRVELGWLGYGPLSDATWLSPHDRSGQVEELAARLKITEYVHVFHARHAGSTDPERIISRCWELPRIHKKYGAFLARYQPKLQSHRQRVASGETIPASECFVARFNLIDEYRRLPFFDPDLPLELLPEDWLRPRAAALFAEYHDALTEKANEYFDLVSRGYRQSAEHPKNKLADKKAMAVA